MKPPRKKFHARDYAAIIERQHGLCACGCNEELSTWPGDIHYDHELPLWCGGTDTLDNLRALIRKHHLAKTRGEAKALAKTRRIVAKNGHRTRDLNSTERELAKILESHPALSIPEGK